MEGRADTHIHGLARGGEGVGQMGEGKQLRECATHTADTYARLNMKLFINVFCMHTPQCKHKQGGN